LQQEYDQLALSSTELLAQQRNGLYESNRALFDSIQALKADTAARDAAKEAAAKASSDAMNALQRAVDAQRKIVQVARDAAAESVTEITSVFDILKSSVKELYGTVDSTAKLQADQGRAFISQALATAQSTGYLPESKALTDAINAAKGDSREFVSQLEKDFATLTLAGDLSLLETLSKTQLTAAEQALKFQDDQLLALDNALSLAQQEIDAANGIDTSIKSVEAAVSVLAVALGIQQGASSAAAAASPWAGYRQMYNGIDIGKAKADQQKVTDLWMLSPTDLAAMAGTAGIPSNILELRQDALFGSGAGSNGTAWLDVLAKAAGASDDYFKYANSKLSGVPQYEIGTNYVPSDGLAYLHQGEAVIPREQNPFNPNAKSNNAGISTEKL
jgi:hypothetical protein